MTEKNHNGATRENFSSQFGLIMAAVGSAVGLGNVWRFSYMAGINGGGAFLLVYIACVLLVGLPILISELTIGRKSGLSPVAAFKHLAPGTFWWVSGALAVFSAAVITAYYPIVTGWALGYVFESLFNWSPISANPGAAFEAFSSDWKACLAALAALLCAALVVFGGVSGGIEKCSRLLMPALGVILLILLARSLTLPGAMAGVEFLLWPDFSKLGARGVLDALGHSFYSLSVGMGIMITYASYMPKNADLVTAAAAIISLDTLVALLAGLAIFPAVFALGLEPTQGVGLAFATLPAAFAQMPGGQIFSTLFFLLLFIAALTSLISILQVPIAFLQDTFGFSHHKATVAVSLGTAAAGLPAALSFGPMADMVTFRGRTWFELLDAFANVVLPFAGLLGTLFVLFHMGVAASRTEFLNGARSQNSFLARIYGPALRWTAPCAIVLILLNSFL